MRSLRLLPFATHDGATNMAADEALLLSAERGHASLRFYAWSPATLSLGYFQPAAARLTDPRLANLPWVRRASGGATLVHDQELTYALALPADTPKPTGWIARFHAVIQAALATFGVETKLVGADDIRGDVLCFQRLTPGDLICRGFKIAGSAQRKHRGCLLQHGSIILRRSEWTPALPGVLELAGVALDSAALQNAIVKALQEREGIVVTPGEWTEEEQRRIAALVVDKFGASSWNDKR